MNDPGKHEIQRVLKEVEFKKKSAEEAGLDRLFLDVYHRGIRHFPVWSKSIEGRKYIHPDVQNPTENIMKEPHGDVFTTEFSFNGKRYTIVSRKRGMFYSYDVFYSMELLINGEKKFALEEKHDRRVAGARYHTLDIEAYSGDEWVEDFRKLKKHQEDIEREMVREIEKVEDIELTNRLKRDFNIGDMSGVSLRNLPEHAWVRIMIFLIALFVATFLWLAAIIAIPGLRSML